MCFALAIPAILAAQEPADGRRQEVGRPMPAAAEQLFALANDARRDNGAGRLQWDPALAEAARQHCERMAQEGPISHRYGGEPDLAARAEQAGAKFSLIEENVAIGPTAAEIQNEWMHSPGHRTNMLNPQVDRIGVAVVYARGVLYAVEDFSRAVVALSRTQVESQVAALIRVSGIAILSDPRQAREACETNSGMPPAAPGLLPRFVMRWQSADLNRLPQALTERLGSGQYRRASVGSCPAQGATSDFAAYRVAVLLY